MTLGLFLGWMVGTGVALLVAALLPPGIEFGLAVGVICPSMGMLIITADKEGRPLEEERKQEEGGTGCVRGLRMHRRTRMSGRLFLDEPGPHRVLGLFHQGSEGNPGRGPFCDAF